MHETDSCPPISGSMWRDWSTEVQEIAALSGHDALPLSDPIYADAKEGATTRSKEGDSGTSKL